MVENHLSLHTTQVRYVGVGLTMLDLNSIANVICRPATTESF